MLPKKQISQGAASDLQRMEVSLSFQKLEDDQEAGGRVLFCSVLFTVPLA